MRDSRKPVQYPSQDGFYKVVTREGVDWKNFTSCRHHISVGQPYHEDEKFKAAINWSIHRFDKTTVCVNDTLQRYTIKFKEQVSMEEANSIAYNNGTEWIARNINTNNMNIVRWDDWLQHKDYPLFKKTIDRLYTDNYAFKKYVDQKVSEFWDRNTALQPDIFLSSRKQEFFELSTEYLLEEEAIFSLMDRNEKAVDIYPGSVLLQFLIAKDDKDNQIPKENLNTTFMRIDFRRNKAYEQSQVA